jgi:hypothetical protein
MATSQKAKVQVELGRTLVDFAAMTDSGDHQIFGGSGALWSGKDGYEPDVRPNGIVSGLRLLSTHASNDTVTIAAFSAYSAGIEYSVSATSLALTRPSVSNYKICSVIMDDTGTIDEVEGTEGSSFSATRGATGGPPLIPVDAVEIGQVRFDSQSAAVIASDEIYQDMGTHAEYADYPMPEVFNIGNGVNASTVTEKTAHIKFNEVLPLVHTGSVPKAVYIKYYAPTFTTLARTSDFKAAELGVTKSSESVYEGSGVSGAIGSMKADSVGDVTVTVFANDGVTDAILREKGEVMTIKFFPNANKAPYLLSQGMVGVSRDFPSGEQNKINLTVYCGKESVEFAS